MGMLFEYLVDVAWIVLAAECDDQSTLLIVENSPLKVHVGVAGILRSQRDAVDTVFSYDATPQGIVCVEDNNLRLGKFDHGADADHPARNLPRRVDGKGEPSGIPIAQVEEVFAAGKLQHFVEVEEQRRFQ